MSIPRVKLQLQPVPRSIMRVAIAGEYLRNMGMQEDQQIGNIQQAVAEGLVRRLTVAGRASDGRVRALFHLDLDRLDTDDRVMLDLTGGRSHLEALDTGFAGGIAWSVEYARRQRLTAEFFVVWSPKALANPQLLAETSRRLNLIAAEMPMLERPQPGDPYAPPVREEPDFTRPARQTVTSSDGPPPLPAGYGYQTVLSITPAKDPGVRFVVESARRQR